MFSIKNKNVFIAGGSMGIGLEIVKRFIGAGANVVVADIHDGDGVLEEIGATYIKTDVSIESEVVNTFEMAVKKLGKLDTVINNVGIYGEDNTFEEFDTTVFDKIISVNIKGVYHGLKYAPRHLNDGGSIINTTSQIAFTQLPGGGPYAATKAAVVSMTKTAALELASRKIRVNAVAPTIVDTAFIVLSEEEKKFAANNIPLGRVSIPEDLPGTYHFLAADESAFITGNIIHIDGGWTAGLSYTSMEMTAK